MCVGGDHKGILILFEIQGEYQKSLVTAVVLNNHIHGVKVMNSKQR